MTESPLPSVFASLAIGMWSSAGQSLSKSRPRRSTLTRGLRRVLDAPSQGNNMWYCCITWSQARSLLQRHPKPDRQMSLSNPLDQLVVSMAVISALTLVVLVAIYSSAGHSSVRSAVTVDPEVYMDSVSVEPVTADMLIKSLTIKFIRTVAPRRKSLRTPLG